MSRLFTSGGQNKGASASALSMNIQGWFPLGLTGLISRQSKGLFKKSLLQQHSSEASVQRSACFIAQLSHPYLTTEKKPYLWLSIWTFFDKVMPLLFNMLSRSVIAFLPSLNFMAVSTVHSYLKPKKIKSVTASRFSPSIRHEVMEPNAMKIKEKSSSNLGHFEIAQCILYNKGLFCSLRDTRAKATSQLLSTPSHLLVVT